MTFRDSVAPRLARQLDRAGVDVTATRYNGLIHDYGLLNPISRVPGVRSALLTRGDRAEGAPVMS